MNHDTKAIVDGLMALRNDPMTTRKNARLFMDAVVLLDWLERNLGATEFALQKLRAAQESEILAADKGALLVTQEVPPTPKKKGRPPKNQQSVHDEGFPGNSGQKY